MRSSLSRAGLAVDAAASCTRCQGRGGLLSVSPKTACGRTALSGSSCQYFGGNVHNAVEPCGANEPCVRQNRVVLAVVATVKLLRRRQLRQPARSPVNFAKAREARRNSAPGRARHKPSDHRAGKAVCWASPVCCCAVFCVCLLRSGPRVPPAPGLPCALLAQGGGEMKQSSGELSRENVKPRLRPHTRCHRPARPDDPVLRDGSD
ncbi:hypothetical protein ACVIIV_007018 [Bradyrhizobium sp. USDA 4354]